MYNCNIKVTGKLTISTACRLATSRHCTAVTGYESERVAGSPAVRARRAPVRDRGRRLHAGQFCRDYGAGAVSRQNGVLLRGPPRAAGRRVQTHHGPQWGLLRLQQDGLRLPSPSSWTLLFLLRSVRRCRFAKRSSGATGSFCLFHCQCTREAYTASISRIIGCCMFRC
jgi:hypothetical protein